MKRASQHTLQLFYQHLGHLFYAVAAADHHIKREEVTALDRMVHEEWLTLESSHDDFGSDAAFGIETNFDMAVDKGWSPETAYHSFETFYQENPELFSGDVIQRIFSTCRAIATSFQGANKSEMAMVNRIHLLLGNPR